MKTFEEFVNSTEVNDETSNPLEYDANQIADIVESNFTNHTVDWADIDTFLKSNIYEGSFILSTELQKDLISILEKRGYTISVN